MSVILLALFRGLLTANAQPVDWTGHWHTYWREGDALVTLTQDGDRVTGRYEPQNGRIEATTEGEVLRGRWFVDGVEGTLLFAMAPDGLTFTGRFDSGEYWNGQRVDDAHLPENAIVLAKSPREALRKIINAANAAVFDRDSSATRVFDALLVFAGNTTDTRDYARRRQKLWQLLNMSTFKIYDAPARSEADEAVFDIGPVGSQVTYPLLFRKTANDTWRLVVDSEDDLSRAVNEFLEDLGFDSIEAYAEAHRDTPRATMRRFVTGVDNWYAGGDTEALASLDLAFLPPHLRSIEGPILADYLMRIINRAGFVVWQEIPNNPSRPMPYVFFDHPVGKVTIERVEQGEGEIEKWLFSAETLQDAPELFAAIQTMPPVEGISPPQALSRFFELREWIRTVQPGLLKRAVSLENWQWLALPISIALAALLGWLAGWAVHAGTAARQSTPDPAPDDEVVEKRNSGLPWAIGVSIGGIFLIQAIGVLGIFDGGFDLVGRGLAVITISALTVVLYQLVGFVGNWFMRRAMTTSGSVDEIVTSLATGLVKGAVVVAGILAVADVVQLPYEGVIAGLGVGGIALAFASRETVSNMLGGILLMTDRPFKRGDLVQTENQLAEVVAVGLRSTRLRRLDDAVMIIPNSLLSERAIVNWGMRRRRRVIIDIGLTFDTPRDKLDQFVSELRNLYLSQPNADPTDCYVGLKNLGSSSIEIECRGYFIVESYEEQIGSRDRLVGDVIDLARNIGVDFAFPTRTLHIAEEAQQGQAVGSAVETDPTSRLKINI